MGDKRMEHNMDDVVETVKNAKERGKKCTLLIGAGCSVTAGIPTAKGFVGIIEKDYTRAFKRAKTKTYAHCMAELSLGERRDLIADYADKAKVNWAHIAIAQLMKAGFVDRVLTTNFDLLFVRACALLGQFPAVYDFAASQLFKAADIPDQAVFYLHGQRTGFVLMNTEDECKRHSELLAPVFEDAGKGRVWLVVGYSGENDPVFDHLAKVPRFDNKLYWIVYKDDEPAAHVRQYLLVNGKDAFYVKGFNADDFFVTLAQKLNSFPPDFVSKPFSHLDSLLEMITPYTLPEETTQVDVTDETRKLIRTAIDTQENAQKTQSKELLSRTYLMEGKYDEVIALLTKETRGLPPKYTKLVSWAYIMQGNSLFDKAKTKKGDEADRLFALAVKKYQAALKIKSDYHEALNNWGLVLSSQAKTKKGKKTDRLFTLAMKKYQEALEIKPDYHKALYNWGLALFSQAKTKTGKKADHLFTLAVKKYQGALEIKPDYHEALNNWGLALFSQAKTKTGKKADHLFTLAVKKYQGSLEIKPDYYKALYNWGLALFNQAKTKTSKKADRLFDLAVKKYQKALEIKPDYHEALNNWGYALFSQAKTKTGKEADRLFTQSKDLLLKAESISPGISAYNIACWCAIRGQENECRKWLEKCLDLGVLPSRQHLEKDQDLEKVREKPWFKVILARL